MDQEVAKLTRSQIVSRTTVYLGLAAVFVLAIAYKRHTILDLRNRSIPSIYAEHREHGVPVSVEILEPKDFEIIHKTTARVRNNRKLTGYVTADFNRRLSTGQSGSVVENGQIFQGRVTYVSSIRDLDYGLFAFTFLTEKPLPRAVPGKHVRLTITTRAISNAITVPNEAVLHNQDKPFVWRVAQNKAMQQIVNLGASNGIRTLVKKGLSQDDQVVVAGQNEINQDTKVRIY